MKDTITQEQIEQAKQPKTRTENKSILEGEPKISEAWMEAFRGISRHPQGWLMRYYFHQLYIKMLTKDNSDEIFGHTTLVSNLKTFLQGIATYCDRYPERIPDVCAALAGKSTLLDSTDMTAIEARDHIRNTPLEELEDFVYEDEDRETVLKAWRKKVSENKANLNN